MADPRIPTGPLEQEPTPLFLPVVDRQWLLYHALANIRLGAWDQRIVDWLAKSTDTSTLLTILSLIERAKAAERSGEHDREPAAQHGPKVCPQCDWHLADLRWCPRCGWGADAASDRGGPRLPAVETPGRDVNPACGHRLRAYCEGCGTCTACDGCYCEEP
jgi:hypothetical protein